MERIVSLFFPYSYRMCVHVRVLSASTLVALVTMAIFLIWLRRETRRFYLFVASYVRDSVRKHTRKTNNGRSLNVSALVIKWKRNDAKGIKMKRWNKDWNIVKDKPKPTNCRCRCRCRRRHSPIDARVKHFTFSLIASEYFGREMGVIHTNA